MNSHLLKTAALCWLRFGRRMQYVATEVGNFSADVLGASDTSMIEIETKISKADLKKDFTKPKHNLYRDNRQYWWIPNYFYFLVPESLKDFAVQLVNEKNPKLGVIVYRDSEGPLYRLADRLEVAKKATKLHAIHPKPKILEKIALRMSSDLANLYLHKLADGDMWSKLLESSKSLSSTPDLDAMDEEPMPLGEPQEPEPARFEITDQLIESLYPEWAANPGVEFGTKMGLREGVRSGLEYAERRIVELEQEVQRLSALSLTQPVTAFVL